MKEGKYVREFRQKPDLNQIASLVSRASRDVKRAKFCYNGIRFYKSYRKISRALSSLGIGINNFLPKK